MIETHKRTIARMITYRLTAWVFTILWTYLFTENLGNAAGFATVLHILLSVDYYIHERIWINIKWGTNREPKVLNTE
jgi:uncharacterized membrane protein